MNTGDKDKAEGIVRNDETSEGSGEKLQASLSTLNERCTWNGCLMSLPMVRQTRLNGRSSSMH